MDEPFLPHLEVESLFDEVIDLSGGCRVDALLPPNPTTDNADYYFERERVFAELKEIHEDANEDEALRDRVSELYARFVAEGNAPALKGERAWARIDLLPDDCRRKILSLFRKKRTSPAVPSGSRGSEAARSGA